MFARAVFVRGRGLLAVRVEKARDQEDERGEEVKEVELTKDVHFHGARY